MLSHDLARALLARRNNDLRFEVEIVPAGLDEHGVIRRVDLLDDRMRAIAPNEPAPEIIRYNSEDDALMISLGAIFLGRINDPPPEGLCSNRSDHEPHLVTEGSLAPFWCTAEQSKRQPNASQIRWQ